MPKHGDIDKILIIGSGPVTVGQAGELDQAGAQTCDALRSMGYHLVIAHSDPAALITDFPATDQVYIEPLDFKTLSQIIAAEKPDAVLPTVGGQTALNLTVQLLKKEVLQKDHTTLLGLSPLSLYIGVDRTQLKKLALPKGIEHTRCSYVSSDAEAVACTEKSTYPVVIRSGISGPDSGNVVAYNVEELHEAVKTRLTDPRNQHIILEEALLGWQELEVIMVRDAKGGNLIWASLENLDPVGIHHGDSVATIPPRSIPADLLGRLEEAGRTIAQTLGIVGMISMRFAWQTDNDRVVLLNITPRASRSTALASLAVNIPIHRTAAMLAGGMLLSEMPWWSPSSPPMQRLPSHKTVVKYPHWVFDKFKEVPNRLEIRKQSVGEVVGIGDDFNAAFQKALRSLFTEDSGSDNFFNIESYRNMDKPNPLVFQSSARYLHLLGALQNGESVSNLAKSTGIDPFFLNQLKELGEIEAALRAAKGEQINDDLLIKAKSNGFSDRCIAVCSGCPHEHIRDRIQNLKNSIESVPTAIPSATDSSAPSKKQHPQKSYLIIGPGHSGLGHGLGFDHSSIQAAQAVKDAGHNVIRVNCNPASATVRNDSHETVYIEPLDTENLSAIYAKEGIHGVLVPFCGPLSKWAASLSHAGMQLTGIELETLATLNDNIRFRNVLKTLGIAQPTFKRAQKHSDLFEAAAKIGYPLLIRPERRSTRQDSDPPLIIMDAQMLSNRFDLEDHSDLPEPLLVERFIEYAVECEVDAICDGREVFIPTVLENIELAGVSSADSASVTPPYSTPLRHVETIHEYTRKIVEKLNIRGLLNLRFAIFNDTVYVLDAVPWASRTLPLTSKICNIPMAYAATRILLGASLAELGLKHPLLPYFSVREAVFPFANFPQVDPLLGPQVYSTGSVLSLADSFGLSYFKSQEAILMPLPLEGAVLITVTDADKPSILEPARLFIEMGFAIKATKGTQVFLENNGIPSEIVRKLGYGRPNLVDAIKTGEIDIVINTPSGKQSQIDDSDIRKAAIQCQVPNITTPAGALAAAKGIAARLKGRPQIKSLNEYHLAAK